MRVSVVIPAYNEARYIERVLKVAERAKERGIVDEIIVVDDGSTDKTSEVATKYAKVVTQPNGGKGAAIQAGLNKATGEVILLLDADLLKLTEKHLERLLAPLEDEKIGMTIGVFKNTDFASAFGNQLVSISGQRAFRLEQFGNIPKLATSRYGADVLLTRYAKRSGQKIAVVSLAGVSQVFKEQKDGLLPGVIKRIKMYIEIFKVLWS